VERNKKVQGGKKENENGKRRKKGRYKKEGKREKKERVITFFPLLSITLPSPLFYFFFLYFCFLLL
jgi:hypothetical protein